MFGRIWGPYTGNYSYMLCSYSWVDWVILYAEYYTYGVLLSFYLCYLNSKDQACFSARIDINILPSNPMDFHLVSSRAFGFEMGMPVPQRSLKLDSTNF